MAPRRSPPLTVLVTMLAIHPSRSDCAQTSGGIATKNPMIRVKLGFIISYFVVFKKLGGEPVCGRIGRTHVSERAVGESGLTC